MRNFFSVVVATTLLIMAQAPRAQAQDPVTLARNKQFASTPTFTVTGAAVKPLLLSSTGVSAWDGSKSANWVLNLKTSNDSVYESAAGYMEYYNHRKVNALRRGANYAGQLDLYDSTGGNVFCAKDSASMWLISSQRKVTMGVKGRQAFTVDTFHIVTVDTALRLAFVPEGTPGSDSILVYNSGRKQVSKVYPGLPVTKVEVTLVAGVATISDARVSSTSGASYSIKSVNGTIGAYYVITYSSGTITVTSKQSGGTTQTLDTSKLMILYTP